MLLESDYYILILLKVVLLGAGAFIATHKRIGNVSRWSDVGKHFRRITSKCFPMVSAALIVDENKLAFWNHFIESMYKVRKTGNC